MSIFSDDRANELRDLFFESAQEILQVLNEDALKLEKSPDDAEIIRSIRRSVHTIKGDSAACGYKELSELAHAVEDVLTPEVAAQSGAKLAELVLIAADSFENLLAAYRGQMQPPGTEAVHQLIEALRHPQPEAVFAPEFSWTEYETLMIANSAVRGQQVYNIALAIDPACPMRAAAAQLVRNVLQEAGNILVMRPEENSGTVPDVVEVALASHHPIDWVTSKSKIPTVVSRVHVVAAQVVPAEAASGEAAPAAKRSAKAGRKSAKSRKKSAAPPPETSPAEVTPAAAAAPPQENAASAAFAAAVVPAEPAAPATMAAQPTEEAKAAPATPANSPAAEKLPENPPEKPKIRDERIPAATENVIRVEAERIDTVLDLVGELIIAKSMTQELLAEMNRALGSAAMRARTSDVLLFQSQILNKLQRSVMKIRMVPVEQVFRRLPRVVRDTAKQLSREVNLVIEGEDTDLDKSILDALGEPLMHLLRNAVDHGIEPPTERITAGKPAEGTIRLNAYHQGNQVVIEVSDDGRGIDVPKLVGKAVDRGIVTADQAEKLTEAEAMDLIFHAGLSTASQVTRVSGRGVGMDVVRAVMDRLKGTVVVRSALGEGTTFRLKVPLTLAIIKALLFRVCDRMYAVPLGNVVEIVRANDADIHFIDEQEVLRIREQVVPLIRLSAMHGTREHRSHMFIIVVAVGEQKTGLVVERLIGEQELVIKALDDSMVSSQLVSGASILGDGRVVLILSITDVLEKLGRGYVRKTIEAESTEVRR